MGHGKEGPDSSRQQVLLKNHDRQERPREKRVHEKKLVAQVVRQPLSVSAVSPAAHWPWAAAAGVGTSAVAAASAATTSRVAARSGRAAERRRQAARRGSNGQIGRAHV